MHDYNRPDSDKFLFMLSTRAVKTRSTVQCRVS